MKENIQIKFVAKAAIIAALYIVIGIVFRPWDFYALQIRPSEALNILVFFTPAAAWGLFVGCIINNLSSPFGLVDIIFGSLATLASGLIGSKIKNKYLVGIPSVLINGFVVAAIITTQSGLTLDAYWAIMINITLCQLLSVYVLGLPLLLLIDKNKKLKELIKL